MIESVEMWGFQIHDRRKIIFGPGVTCLVGDTDSGKSAVLRALLWACMNQPAGDAMIRHGSTSCKVRVSVDGVKITRKRGKANAYYLGTKKFVSFGASVPDDIAKQVNLASINFQQQFDPPFWFMDSAGNVARELNSVVDLTIIDVALSNSQAMLKRARAEVEVSQDRLKQHEEELNKLSWVPKFSRTIKAAEDLQEQILEDRVYVAALTVLVERGARLACESEVSASHAQSEQTACEVIAETLLMRASVRDLESLIESAAVTDRLSKVTTPSFSALDAAMVGISELQESYSQLAGLVERATELEKLSCQSEKSAIRAAEQFQEAASFACPLCGRAGE